MLRSMTSRHALAAIQEREDRIQQSIARSYDDLANGRIRPWTQVKARGGPNTSAEPSPSPM